MNQEFLFTNIPYHPIRRFLYYLYTCSFSKVKKMKHLVDLIFLSDKYGFNFNDITLELYDMIQEYEKDNEEELIPLLEELMAIESFEFITHNILKIVSSTPSTKYKKIKKKYKKVIKSIII